MSARPTPPGATACHCHIFGPAARFPCAEPRSYTPEDETLEDYLALLDRLGLDRGVVVQPSAYDRDNACTRDALRRAPDRLRGIAVVGAEATSDTLRAMHRDGIRGLRARLGHGLAPPATRRRASGCRAAFARAPRLDPGSRLATKDPVRGAGAPLRLFIGLTAAGIQCRRHSRDAPRP
jgi:predicted TIM-barrel fold metal-dependent hydrolase